MELATPCMIRYGVIRQQLQKINGSVEYRYREENWKGWASETHWVNETIWDLWVTEAEIYPTPTELPNEVGPTKQAINKLQEEVGEIHTALRQLTKRLGEIHGALGELVFNLPNADKSSFGTCQTVVEYLVDPNNLSEME